MTDRSTDLRVDELDRTARRVLAQNDLGTMVAAAPRLYPHQWSWDAAFISVGLARVSVARALTELRSLLAAQWSTGMIPHIVFSPGTSYFPGPDVWGTDRAAAKPSGVQTSGICQPPVHAIALARILQIAADEGGPALEEARVFAAEAVPRLAAWHRWLSTARDPDGQGLVQIHHGWESGMDNSPRWDAAYAAITVTQEQELRRHDTALVADVSERPSDAEYQRYLHLVAQMRSVDYDDSRIAEVIDFRVGDVFMTAILAVAAEELTTVGRDLGMDKEVADQMDIAARARAAVLASVAPDSGLCRDWDARAGAWTDAESLASFSVLLCGGDDEVYARQRETITGPRWAGHPGLRFALPPTLSPDDPGFRPRTYWRGPIWPVMNWLFWWALERHGDKELADRWRSEGLGQLADLTCAEYYEPLTGDPLGSHDQSWTAAAALDWLATSR
jgi:glucosylglycerate hydrolase